MKESLIAIDEKKESLIAIDEKKESLIAINEKKENFIAFDGNCYVNTINIEELSIPERNNLRKFK